MNGFTVCQKYDPQIFSLHFRNLHPSADTTVHLNVFFHRLVDRPLYPFQFDDPERRSAQATFNVDALNSQ
jgi:hypothetical protein